MATPMIFHEESESVIRSEIRSTVSDFLDNGSNFVHGSNYVYLWYTPSQDIKVNTATLSISITQKAINEEERMGRFSSQCDSSNDC